MAHVLILDDEKNVGVAVAIMVKENGHTYVLVHDIEAALDAAHDAQASGRLFDLLILDYDLGDGTTGFQVLENIRDKMGDQRAILLTGLPLEQLRASALEIGFRALVRKPVHFNEFLPVMTTVLAEPVAKQEHVT